MRIDDSQLAHRPMWRSWVYVCLIVTASAVMFFGLVSLVAASSAAAHGVGQSSASSALEPMAPAAPIPPPEGYPKLSRSTKTVSPTLAETGGAELIYTIEIRNTGATTATDTMLVDTLPDHVTYNGDAWASHGQSPILVDSTLVWTGEVGFDSTVVVTFSVNVDSGFVGKVRNTAVISDAQIAKPVTVTAETVVTDEPILVIEKRSWPAKPGANKPLFYELQVTNWGQSMPAQAITVTDQIPTNTTFLDVGPDGVSAGDMVTWTRQLSLALGQSTSFSFSVTVGDVASGTVIANENYAVAASFGVTTGKPYTVTIIDPIFLLSKRVWPDPPGSNREMTYTLTLRNIGSLATDLIITDRIPDGVSYVRGGTAILPVVHWALDSLDTGESAQFTYTVYVSDIMKVPIVNRDYEVCSAEEACASGKVLTNVVQGPKFEVKVIYDPHPAVKSPGGSYDVTPTLTIHNVGPGNAIDAAAVMTFERVKAWINDLEIVPAPAVPWPGDGGNVVYDCGDKCGFYVWTGDLDVGETITFTTQPDRNGYRGVSTIGGEEGTTFTSTILVTDELTTFVGGSAVPITTVPVTASAVGTVTHMANLRPLKDAPAVVAPGQLMTYTIHVVNTGQSTDQPPQPWLWDVVPMSTTVVSISDGGVVRELTGTFAGTVISWTLPAMNTGDEESLWFTVRVDEDVVSGTKIVNGQYATFWWQDQDRRIFTRAGRPVTTTVQEVGLIDSFKVVDPRLSLPGPDVVLNYTIHLSNSSGVDLSNVTAHDLLPWADSTYQRDAVASSGTIVSDIVSIDWHGDIDAFSEVLVTFTVQVDPDFEGVLTNTVTIDHADLLAPIERHAVAYVTTNPVLSIQKTATPDPVQQGERLTYRLRVTNMGQQATTLVITDVVPSNVTYVPDSATAGGEPDGDAIRWDWPLLEPGKRIDMSFQVTVEQGTEVVNAQYGVRSFEGAFAMGAPVVTSVEGAGAKIYLPLVMKQ